MARETFTGRLVHTQARVDGPGNKPVSQALFHTVDDNTPAVAVWHGQALPEGMQAGQVYQVEGDYIYHKERHFFFQPMIELLEAEARQAPVRVRHLLLRPRDWRRVHQIAAAVSLALMLLVSALVLSYASGDNRTVSQPPSEPAASRQAEQAGVLADTAQPATAQPSVQPTRDCDTRLIAYQTLTRRDATQPNGTRTITTPGVNGVKQICYPEGRAKPPVETVTQAAVNEMVSLGSKPNTTAVRTVEPVAPPTPNRQPASQPAHSGTPVLPAVPAPKDEAPAVTGTEQPEPSHDTSASPPNP